MTKCKNCNCTCHCGIEEHSDMYGVCSCTACSCGSEEVIDELQKKLISGNLSIPDGLKRESFVDD